MSTSSTNNYVARVLGLVRAVRDSGRHDADEAAALALVTELDGAGDLGKQRVVLAQAHEEPRLELAAPLPDENGTARHEIAVVLLHAKPLGIAVATVAGTA